MPEKCVRLLVLFQTHLITVGNIVSVGKYNQNTSGILLMLLPQQLVMTVGTPDEQKREE